MEVGIIVSAAVLIGIITAYYYVQDIKHTQMDLTGKTANNTTTQLAKGAKNVTDKISNIVDNIS